jgi:hypothetical protein
MTLQIETGQLKQILRAAVVVHTEGECCIEIGTDGIRLRALSPDKTVYLDYSLPYSKSLTPHNEEPGDTWIKLRAIKQLLNTIDDDDVQLTLPVETSESESASEVVVESETVVYRSHSLHSPYGHELPADPELTPVSICSIPHAPFKQSVRIANWLGGDMDIRLVPDSRHIEFSAAQRGGDDFSCVVPTEEIEAIHGSTTEFKIPIGVLRDLIHTIPENTLITLSITQQYLQYTATYPSTDATLRLYIAQRKGRIPK